MKKKLFFIFLMMLASSQKLLAQTTSWEGTHFVFTQPNHQFVLINVKVCSKDALTGSISFEDTIINFNSSENDCASINIDRSAFDSILKVRNNLNEAINLVTDKPATCYVTIFNTAEDEGYNVLPVSSLTNSYHDSYLSSSTLNDTIFFKHIIAIEDSTIIDYDIGTNQKDTLQKNDVLVLRTPKLILNSNKAVALFSTLKSNIIGSNCGFICCSEELYEQVLPNEFIGDSYIISPIHNNNESIVSIYSLEDNTCVEINGQTTIYNKEKTFSFYVTDISIIRASKKINVHRFFESNGCMNNAIGDPELFQCSPITSLTKNSIFYTPNGYFQKYYLNIIIPNESIDSIYLDDENIKEKFTKLNDFYQLAEIEILAGKHFLIAKNGFKAFVYGVSNNMSGPNSAGYNLIGPIINSEYKFKLNNSYKKTILCENEITTYISTDTTSQFLWNDGSTFSNRTFNDSGLYVVQITNNCLNYQYSDTLEIEKTNCLCTPNVPQAFSPNGDGKNDELLIEFSCVNSQTFELKIFNRWGNLIFENKNLEKYWNGKDSNMNECENGSYVYVIHYLDGNLNKQTKTGIFNIIK